MVLVKNALWTTDVFGRIGTAQAVSMVRLGSPAFRRLADSLALGCRVHACVNAAFRGKRRLHSPPLNEAAKYLCLLWLRQNAGDDFAGDVR